jgi:hypothetical protein
MAIEAYINSVTLSNKTLSLYGSSPLDRALLQLIASNEKVGVQLSTCSDADKSRLKQRFAYLAFAYSMRKGGTDWFAKPNECEWTGITCTGTAVKMLSLPRQALNGTIPDDVGLWSGLLTFNVNSNQLVGPLPPSIGLWTNITIFSVYNNQLAGTVPKEVSKWTSLQEAYLFQNMFFGIMPDFGNGFCPYEGKGLILYADCSAPAKIKCYCCTMCN